MSRLRYRVALWLHLRVTGEPAARAAAAFAVCTAPCCRRRWNLWRRADGAVVRLVRLGNQ